jgi:hypothetical protein
MQALHLTDETRILAGIVLLTVPTIEIGGWFLTRVARGAVPMTPFQKGFARAGHAHAGVLVTLSLITLLLADATRLNSTLGWAARAGVPAAAILIPAGFFFSIIGSGEVTRPNRLMHLIWPGAVALAIGVITTGVGLLAA